MTDSLGTLLSGTFAYYKTKFVPVAIGAVVFGALMYGAQLYFQQESMNMMQGNPYANMDHLEELAKKAEGGDEAAMKQLMEEAAMMMGEGMEGMEGMDKEAMAEKMAMNMIKGVLPAFGMFFVISMLISVVAGVYFLVLGIDATATAQSAFGKVPSLVLPLLGVWIWTFIRSFAWIPIIGIVFGLYFGPRLIMSPVILVKEKLGVMGSTKASIERSKGYWGKIFGNLFMVGLAMWVVMFVVSVPLGMMAHTASLLMSVSMVVSYFITAYIMFFIVKLTDTITLNPKKV